MYDIQMNISSIASRVLKAIYDLEHLEGATRRSIASRLACSVVVVSKALSELESHDMISKTTLRQNGGGRPVYLYSVQPSVFTSIGVSVDVDCVRAVRLDSDRKIIGENVAPIEWGKDGSALDSLTARIRSSVDALLGEDISAPPVEVIGLSVPGLVDSPSGLWLRGLQIPGIRQVNLETLLHGLQMPVLIEDHTRSLTFREMETGHGRDVEDFVLINLTVGVGAGIVVRRRIHRGLHGLAGEVGHIVVDPNGRRCVCGMVGCAETICSVPSIRQSTRDLSRIGVATTLSADGPAPTVEEIAAAAREGDRAVTTTLAEAEDALVKVVATLVVVMNPGRVIITGPGGSLFEPTRDSLERKLRLHSLPEVQQDMEVVFSEYTTNQEAEGVAMLSVSQHWPEDGHTWARPS